MSSYYEGMTFHLSYENIDHFSEQLDTFHGQVGVRRMDRLRTRLLIEDILINLRSHYGEQQEVDAFFEKQLLGSARVRLEIKADPYNPLGNVDGDLDDWSKLIFSSIGLHAQYAYSVDTNALLIKLPKKAMNPVLKMTIALLLGVSVGFIGNTSALRPLCSTLSSVFLHPIYNVWLRLLAAISGPIIFFTATTTMLNTKRITERGGSVYVLVARYFALTAAFLLLALPSCMLIFPLNVVWTNADLALVQKTLDALFSVVPNNLFEAFSSANTPQLLLIAFVLGNVLVKLGNKTSELKLIVRQTNVVGLTVAEWTSSLVPYFAAIFLCLGIWSSHSKLLMNMWKPLFLSLAISTLALLVSLVLVAINKRINPFLLGRKLKSSFWYVLKKGSLSGPLDELIGLCKKQLGIDSAYAKAAMPQGLNLYMPISAVGIFVFSIFVAQMQHVPVDQMWIMKALVMAVALFVATPPVAGANLLAYVAFFTYLGISESALMDAMIFDIIFGVFANAANLAMLQLETIMQASRSGFLDKETLRRPLAQ